MNRASYSLAMSNIAWSPEERLEAYRLMAKAGLTGLEIAPGLFFHAAEDPFTPDAASAAQALSEAESFGFSLVSMQSLLFGVQGAGLFDGPSARARLVSGLNRAIDLANRFGIPNLVFGSPAQRRVPESLAMSQALDEAAEVFHALGERAAQAGTKIAIEANPAAYGTNFLTTLDEALAFVRCVDHPAIAPILDLGAMHMNHELASTPARVPALMPELAHVHVSEPGLAPAPADAAAVAPVFKALEEAGYARCVSIEMKRAQGGLAEVEGALARLSLAAQQIEGRCHA
jgi:sugar phosphate isomerase/epimerase